MKMRKFYHTILLIGLSVLFCSSQLLAQSQDSVHVDLNKAIEIALSETPTMRIADRDVQVKKYYKKEQIASLFPDVSLAGNYNRTLLKQQMSMDMVYAFRVEHCHVQ